MVSIISLRNQPKESSIGPSKSKSLDDSKELISKRNHHCGLWCSCSVSRIREDVHRRIPVKTRLARFAKQVGIPMNRRELLVYLILTPCVAGMILIPQFLIFYFELEDAADSMNRRFKAAWPDSLTWPPSGESYNVYRLEKLLSRKDSCTKLYSYLNSRFGLGPWSCGNNSSGWEAYNDLMDNYVELLVFWLWLGILLISGMFKLRKNLALPVLVLLVSTYPIAMFQTLRNFSLQRRDM